MKNDGGMIEVSLLQKGTKRIMAILLSFVIVVTSFLGAIPGKSAAAAESFNGIAAKAIALLEGSFDAIPDNPYNAGWRNAASILETTIDYMQHSGSRAYVPIVEKTFKESKEAYSKNFINENYDDEGWWAITWIKAYELTGEVKYLDMAKVIFADMTTGWDDTAGGGIWSSKNRSDKNAISNELFLVVAARLHNKIPGDVTYLSWATKTWEWFKETGMINGSNLINDGLKLDQLTGQYVNNEGTVWTANQGVIVGGLVALSEATNDPSLLVEAQKIADAVISSSTLNVDGVLTEPCESYSQGCDDDQARFKGIFMKNLEVLYKKVGNTSYQQFMQSNARSVWANSQNESGQFGVKWAGPFDRTSPTIQASAIDTLNTQVVPGILLNNVALGRPAWTAGSTCSSSESAASALDGSLDTQWCITSSPQSLTIDLVAVKAISQFVIYHAGSNKANVNMNSQLNMKDYDILTSMDNVNWSTQVKVRDNISNVSTHDISPIIAKYVKLNVITSQSSTPNAETRVVEVMVNGLDIDLSGLTLDRSIATVKVGDITRISANTSTGITWSSDNNSVATVDANGNVDAVAKGVATIVATAADGSTAACVVTVVDNVPAGGGADFYTGFEKTEPQPNWNSTVEIMENVGGSTAGTRGMETKIVNYAGQTNTGFGNVLYYSGKASGLNGADSYSYNRVFSVNIPVTDAVKNLDYWIHPTEANGTYVRVDLAFSDGTYLHNVDGSFYQNHVLTVGQWNHVQASLESAVGKTIQRILVSYYRRTSAGEQAPGTFNGYIDDIRIGDTSVIPNAVRPTDSNIEYVGRWDKSNVNNLKGYWGGTYLRAGFTGTSVKVVLPAKTKMYVSIDNGPDVLYDNAFGVVNLTPTPLIAGDHVLRISTPWADQSLAVQGLILDPGSTTKAPPERTKIVEFIGDAITAGVDNNAVSDYAFLTGEKLNVNHTQVAFSGCLVECDRSTSPGGMVEQYYKLRPVFNAADSSPDWDFSKYTADAVVVNIGTSDIGKGITPDKFQSAYVKLLEGIREKYPDVQILVMRTFNGYYATETQNAVIARQTAGDIKVQYVDTTGWVNADTPDYIDVYHPSNAGHYKITQKLAPIISDALALVPEATPVTNSKVIWAAKYSEKDSDAYEATDPSVGSVLASNSGGWVKYADIDFGDGSYDTIMANLAAWETGHKIEIYKDSIDSNNKIGELTTTSTGTWEIYKEHYAEISSVTGIHDVYLRIPSLYAANLNWFIFAKGVPSNETQEEIDQRMNWFDEARFGQFIHWGAYSVLEGSYSGQTVSYAEWIMGNLGIPKATYREVASQKFNPNLFNAKQWVDLVKQAGQKYIVITSKHHEGFSMFDTEIGDFKPYSVVSMSPSHFDPMAALAKESKEQGIKFGFYYSILDWMHPLYPSDFNPATKDKYVQQMKGQLRELIEKYDADILWFDGEWDGWWTKEDGQALYKYLRTLKNDLIINNRVGKRESDDGDFGTPEQEIPPTGLDHRWESCITINDTWGFSATDVEWKSALELIHILVETSSKGGNLLLNIGPTAAGVTPQVSVERLREMGAWLNVYGDSIYGTKASVFADKLSFGYSTTKHDANNGKVYLHVTNWPTNGQLVLPKLSNTINKVSLLNEPGTTLEYRHVKDYLVIDVPEKVNGKAPNAIDEVIVLEVAGDPAMAAPHPVSDFATGKTAAASDVYFNLSTYNADKAIDGNANTRWATNDGNYPYWLEVDFAARSTFNKIVLNEEFTRIGDYKIQYLVGSEWKDAYSGQGVGSNKTITFPSVTGTKVRLYIVDSLSPQDPSGPSISKFEVYDYSQYSAIPPIISLNGSSIVNLVVGDTFVDPGAAAKDVGNNDISTAIVTSGGVDTSIPGKYTITYDVKDASGMKADRVTRTVNVKPNAVTAAGGAEVVTVTNYIVGATLKLYNASNALVAAKVATSESVQFKSAPAGGKGYYVTQTIDGLESMPSNRVNITAYNPPAALTVTGGYQSVTVNNAVLGATLELYNGSNQFVTSKVAGAAGLLEFTSVPAGTGYYVIQTVDGIVGVPSNKVTVTGPVNPGPGGTGGTGGTGSTGTGANGTTEPGTNVNDSQLIMPIPTVDAAGKATSTLDSQTLEEALQAIPSNSNGVKILEIVIPQVNLAHTYSVVIPAEYVSMTDDATQFNVTTPVGQMSIPSNMFQRDNLQGVQNIAFQLGVQDGVVVLNLSADNKSMDWKRGAAPIAVKVPYTLTAEQRQNSEYTRVSYKDQKGKVVVVPSGKYDLVTGELSFNAPVSGEFEISFVKRTFDDLGKHTWAQKAIEILASKSIINGTSSNRFSPGVAITRADFLLLLINVLELSAEADSSFTDVNPDAYYYNAISAAVSLGITNGIGDGSKFDPTASISRQDMMVMIVRAMKVAKKSLKKEETSAISTYIDYDQISSYAVDSVSSLVQDGIVKGDGSKINPKGITTRAEAAVLIYRLYLK